MRGGRKPVASFCRKDLHINEMATTATNMGAYTVESLVNGLCYFIDDNTVVFGTHTGFMKVNMSTAKTMAKELPQILADYTANRHNGLEQMSTREIQRMLDE